MSDLHAELRCAEAVARQAGRHILRERSKHVDVSLKGPHDLVTNVDRSTERLIVDHIHGAFPDDAISGEEYGDSECDRHADTERSWVIDPIDGTLNFAHGIPLFCVSIALQIDNQTEVAVVYDPNRDELFSALAGHGAHVDGCALSVSSVDTLATSMLVTGFPLDNTATFEATLEQFDDLTKACRGIRRLGSAALDLAYVASGRMEAFWEYGLKPWDTAAGHLLVTEAGGRVTDIQANPFSINAPSIAASNGRVHDELVGKLQDYAPS